MARPVASVLTDIPRLQVCCYLSRIRTELHYRQVLGRVLRRTGEADEQAWLFMLAEPTLQGFAERIADDLPDDLAVLNEVHISATSPGSKQILIDVGGNLDEIVKSIGFGTEQTVRIGGCELHLPGWSGS